MKAVVYNKKLSPDKLVLKDVEKPSPQAGEVLVRIQAVSLNAADYRSMRMGIVPPRKIFGADIAGVVESTANPAGKFEAGDRVAGDISSCGFGGLAEFVSVPEFALVHIPASISFESASAVPMAAITALQALRDKGRIRAGAKVLVYGAGGGVGTFAVQLAKYYGAQVTAVCGPNNLEIVRSLGAGEVLDYMNEDILQSKRRFDLILGINGNNPLSSYKRALAPGGIFVMVGGELSQVIKSLVFGRFSSLGSKKVVSLAARPNAADLEFIFGLVAQGKIKPIIDRCYPLAETGEAMRYLGRGHARGKVVITVG